MVAKRLIGAVEAQLKTYPELNLFLKSQGDEKRVTRIIQLLIVLEWLYQLTISISDPDDCQHGVLHEWLLDNRDCLKDLLRECELPEELGETQFITFLISLLETVRAELIKEHETPVNLSLMSRLLQRDLLGELYNYALTTNRKKTSGIYHTPWIVVDFIISVTVKKQIKAILDNVQRALTSGKEDDMRDAWDKLLHFRVIDPACGSGRFLIPIIPHLLDLHFTVLRMMELKGDKKGNQPFHGLDKKRYSQIVPYLVMVQHLHGIDLDPEATFTCRLNACIQVIMESVRYDPSIFTKHSVFNDFVLLLRISKLNFHVGDALVGCFPCNDNRHSSEKNDHSLLPKLRINVTNFLDLSTQHVLELVQQREQLAHRVKEHLIAIFQEEGFSDSIFNGTLPYCWHDKIHPASCMLGFDVVVGNPPYFRIREISRKNPRFRLIYQYLKKSSRWSQYFRAASDIYYYFILLGIQLLKPEGKLGFIVGNYWLENDHADLLKKVLLARTRIEWLVQFSSRRVFKGVNEDTCILILTKIGPREKLLKNHQFFCLQVKDIQSLQHLDGDGSSLTLEGKSGSKLSVMRISQQELGLGKWVLTNSRSIPASLKIDGYRVMPLGDVNRSVIKRYPSLFKKNLHAHDEILLGWCLVGRGMQSGRNDVFRVQVREFLNDDVALIFNPTYQLTAEIERLFLKKTTRNSFIRRHGYRSLEWLIFIPPGTDITQHPLVLEYLSHFKKELESRHEYKHGKCKWFEYSIYRNLSLFESPHFLMAPYRAKRNVFARNTEPLILLDDCVIVVPKDKRLDTTKYLLGILNSAVMHYWLQHVGKRKGNLLELFSTVLTRSPVPIPQKDIMAEIIKLVSELETLSLEHRELKNEPDKRRQEEIESQLEALVFHAYDMKEDAMKLILEKIGYKKVAIKQILTFHRHR